MTDSEKKELELAGININEALERFMGSEAIVEKFMKKFIGDTSFSQLEAAVEKGDGEEAFKAAHTFKGVCGNLSFDVLYGVLSRQVEFFREGNFELGKGLMPDVKKAYNEVIEAIEKHFK